jgi:hypothetical protein
VNKDSVILYVGEHNTNDIATLDRSDRWGNVLMALDREATGVRDRPTGERIRVMPAQIICCPMLPRYDQLSVETLGVASQAVGRDPSRR